MIPIGQILHVRTKIMHTKILKTKLVINKNGSKDHIKCFLNSNYNFQEDFLY